ncbi:MAG: hypothetical protein EXR55_07095 [Dehalococcoidia bacterium]|nr:hypothetical protein [Dehalococcoidia bacterium]
MPSRYQREIEEILSQTGKTGPQLPETPKAESQSASGGWGSVVARAFALLPWRVSPAKLMLSSAGIMLAAFLLNNFNSPVVGPLVIVGIILFIVAYALFFLPSSRPTAERRWRGRPMEYPRVFWRHRLRRWFRR